MWCRPYGKECVKLRLNRWKVYVSYTEANSDLPASKYVGAGKLPTLNEDILDRWLSIELAAPFEYLNTILRP